MRPTKLEDRRPQGGLTRAFIDFGGGSRAFKMWKKLDALMPAVKQLLKDKGQPLQARMLGDWQGSVNYRLPELTNTWTMELDGEQWVALSRGLRYSGPQGRSMMCWINQHVTYEYPPEGYTYSATYARTKRWANPRPGRPDAVVRKTWPL